VFGDSSSFLYSLILAGISLIILIIACINYLAISITASAGRRSEAAIRKVIGANILHLKGQFYAESFLQVSIAVLLGFTLTQALLPSFNDLAEKEFTLTLFENLRLLFGGLLFGVALTFFAGGYPAQILSRFKALAGLKGNGSHKISSKLIKGMVVFQFTLCLMFISVGLAMREQFEFINNKDLGFDEEQVVYVEGVSGKTNLLKEELAKYPSVIMASGSSGIFVGRIIHGVDPINGVENRISFISIDSDFFQTLGVDLVDVEGVQSVEKEQMASGMSFLNESYLNALKADSLMYAESIASIDGVVVDFHFESLQNEIASQKFEITEPGRLSTLFVKLRPNQIEEGLSAIRESYAKITEKPLEEVKFLDEFLNSRYEDSRKWQRIVNISASIGLLIACIGLFGLTGMGMANQMKELSIRKVLGANARDLAYALNRQSFILIIVASVISIPVSYYLIKRWLNDFAYHVDITAQVFAVSILLLVLITLITVTYHSIKVIFTNPVNILRNE
jgi:putative ABC transport system permease protein